MSEVYVVACTEDDIFGANFIAAFDPPAQFEADGACAHADRDLLGKCRRCGEAESC
jgi:hypothetical protein